MSLFGLNQPSQPDIRVGSTPVERIYRGSTLVYERISESEPISPQVPVITSAGTITGTLTVGQTLSVTGFSVSGNPTPTISYQWQRNGIDIPEATDETYILVEADIGTDVRRQTTATNSEGSVSEVTPGVTIVALDELVLITIEDTEDGFVVQG